MNKLIIVSSLLALACAAQLPSATYLPQSQGSANGYNSHQAAPQRPSATYLPQSQGGANGQHSGNNLSQQPQRPSATYLPQSQGGANGQHSGNNLSQQPQRPSATYLPQSQGSANGPHSGNIPSQPQIPSATYLPQSQGGANGQNGNIHSQQPQRPSATYLPQDASESGNTRSQQAAERSSVILRSNQEIGDNGFHYAYETSNGIQAEESGNVAQTRGAFAYQGDDGKVYSITFTAGEDGYRPQGDHLPVPPPTPEDILEALKKNEQDEAAGIFDDGQYHPENDGQGSSGQGYGSANHGGANGNGYSY